MSKIKNIFKIDPLKSFIELPILWIVVFILLSIAIFVSIIIVQNSNLELSADYNGFNSFTEIFKVPLAILAIIITFVAFLATVHRSAQTREQIISTNRQNTFSNYFKHIDEFEKYISKSISNKSINFKDIRETHKYLFPESIYGNYSINKSFLELIDHEYSKCKSLLELFEMKDEKSLFQIFYEIYNSLDLVFNEIGIKILRSGRQIVQDSNRIVVPDLSLKSVLAEIKKDSITLKQIISFDHSTVISDSLNSILNMNVEATPDWSIFQDIITVQFNVFNIK